MPGFYVHIPFCARRCPYCDFAVSVNSKAEFRSRYVAALGQEIGGLLSLGQEHFDTVFFGGGTPTQLRAATLNEILAPIGERTAPGAEISLEANPENLDFEYLRELRAGGWNRLSLGAQSFEASELQMLGRAHDGTRIESVVNWARRAGFENISLDLIYGAPGTSLESWRRTLKRAIALNVTHISAYSLTIEEGTAFGRAVRIGTWKAPDDDFLGQLMEEAAQSLDGAGFGRYEVSNWAQTGYQSRHNLNYWRGGNYFGAGCGAHGHRDGHRYWNQRDAKIYINAVEKTGSGQADEEFLSPQQRAIELVALGLRCREGFSLKEVSQVGQFDAESRLNGTLKSLISLGVLQRVGGRILPAPQSLAVADGLAARLISQF